MERTINIKVQEHRKTGLLMATSEEMRGLIVHARSEEELQSRLEIAVRDLLEADGHQVDYVRVTRKESAQPAFSLPTFIASAVLHAHHAA